MAENPEPTGCAIGLDVGGTKIAAGLVVHPSGAVMAKRTLPTLPQRGGEAVLSDTLAIAEGLLEEAGRRNLEVLGIGVGVPELVDPAGNITSSHSLAWRTLSVQREFSRLAPAIVESDVRAGALAEAMYGAGGVQALCLCHGGDRHFEYAGPGWATLCRRTRQRLIMASSPVHDGLQRLRHGSESCSGGVRQRSGPGREIQPARIEVCGTGRGRDGGR